MATFLDQMLLELGFDTAKFIKGAKEVQQHVKDTKDAVEKHGKGIEDSMHKAADSIKEVAMRALEMYAVLVAADSIGGFIDRMTKADSATSKLASSLNESIETVSELEMATQRFGGSAGSMDAQLRKISDTFYDLSINGKALPIALSQLMAFSGKNIDFSHGSVKQMLDTAIAIQKMAKTGPEGEAKAGYLARQLGYTDAQIALMIEKGAGLKAYLDSMKHMALTKEQAEAAERYEKAWAGIQQEATNFAHTFWTAVSPAVSAAFKKLSDWMGLKTTQDKFNSAVKAFTDYFENFSADDMIKALKAVKEDLDAIVEDLKAVKAMWDYLAAIPSKVREANKENNPFYASEDTNKKFNEKYGGGEEETHSLSEMWDWIKSGASRVGSAMSRAGGYVGDSIIGGAHAEGYAPRSPFGSLNANAFKVEGRDVSRGNPVPVWIANANPADPNNMPGGPGGSTGRGYGGGGGGGGSPDNSGVGSGDRGGGGDGLTPEQGAELLRSQGATPEEAAFIGAHMGGESRGHAGAHNFHGADLSYGLWQINMIGGMGPQRRKMWGLKSNEDLFDKNVNARAAIALYRDWVRRGRHGPSPWAGSNRFLTPSYSARAARAARDWHAPNVPVGASAVAPSHTPGGGGGGSTKTTTTNVGHVSINTTSKDAHGIARAIKEALANDTFARTQETGLV